VDRQPVHSSNLAEVGYDPATQVLEIAFRTGGIYRYGSVPQDIYAGLMQAGSHGTYFTMHIRNRYPTTRVRSRGRF
jgi:hypothetical protein